MVEPKLIDKVREYGVPGIYDEETEECAPGDDPGYGGSKLSADVEGLTLVTESDGDGHLLASSQGDSTFAAYDRQVKDDNAYEGGFRVAPANSGLDGSEECDGAAALNAPSVRSIRTVCSSCRTATTYRARATAPRPTSSSSTSARSWTH